MLENCKNCKNEVTSNYCSNCGKPVKLKRIDKRYISREFFHLLHFDKGFFYSVLIIGTSMTYDFHEAFGQYNVYNFFMGRQEH